MFQFSKYERLTKNIKKIKSKKYKFNNRKKPKLKHYLIRLFICSIIILLLTFFIKYRIFKHRTNNIFYSPEYIYCNNCSNNTKKISSKCDRACPPEVLFENLKVASNFDTLDEIIKNNKSISRYGDGEYRILLGMRHEFEPANKELAKRLQEVLENKKKNCLVGIFLPLNKERKKFISHEAVYWTYIINDMKWRLFKTIKQDKQYYSAIISKFYLAYRNRSNLLHLNMLKNLNKFGIIEI